MSKFKLIVFDWDGTLVNSTSRIIDSMQCAAREHLLPAVSDAAVQNIIGLGLPEAIKVLWPSISDEQLKLMMPSYARFFVTDSSVAMKMFSGARELLDGLLQSNYLLAVATGKTRKGLDRMVRDLQLGHIFVATRCADETRSKPHPQMLNELLSQLSIAPHEALMVGDTTYDLEMANAAGVASIAMSHGAHDEQRLLACHPLALCHSMHELNEWITNHG